MSECILKKRISHDDMRGQFKNTNFFCPLYEKENIGMKTVGIICGACCIRTQMVSEKLAELILKRAFTYEEFERNPEILLEHLTGELKKYAEVVSELSGKDWESIRGICNRCSPIPVEPQEIPEAEATKMSNVARRDV